MGRIKVVSFATERVVVDFLFTEIFTRFGVPREIVLTMDHNLFLIWYRV